MTSCRKRRSNTNSSKSTWTEWDTAHTFTPSSWVKNSAGGIFKSSMDGVTWERVNKLKLKLHVHSIQWLHTIVKKRRSLEQGKLFRVPRQKKPPDR